MIETVFNQTSNAQQVVDPMPQHAMPNPVEVQEPKKSKWPWVVFVLIVILAVIVGIFYYLFKNNFIKIPSSDNSLTSQTGVPTPKITDLAPDVPVSAKTVVLIQDSDSSFEKVIMPTNQVSTYIKNLPQGSKLISQTSDK